MVERRTLIVAGLGRCGTTMVMRMLAAGGVPTIGEAPDFECVETQYMLEDAPAAWAYHVRGKAVKVLDAHRFAMPDLGEFDLIWLRRNPQEQARSMLKLIASMFSAVQITRQSVRAMKKGIIHDGPIAARRLADAGTPNAIALDFEEILADPHRAARTIGYAFKIPAERWPVMASQVIKRDAKCLPYLMEEALFFLPTTPGAPL